MAALDQDPFSCPICLDPIKDPVTIPCGHNYCMACIRNYWNQDEDTESYSCPECRETFTTKPVLNKNTMFAEVVEQFKKTRLRDDSPANHGPRKCSICTGRKLQAVKFCPQCEESYCDAHEGRHNKTKFREKHTVIVVGGEPSKNICASGEPPKNICVGGELPKNICVGGELPKNICVGGEPPKNICLHHNMPLEIYCRSDQQLICSLCFVEHHRTHDAVSVAPPSAEKPMDVHLNRTRQHRNRSHEHGRRKHRHRSRHGRRHRKSLHLKSGHEAGHHEGHGRTLRRHSHVEGGGHPVGHDRISRHTGWHRSSRHERSGH